MPSTDEIQIASHDQCLLEGVPKQEIHVCVNTRATLSAVQSAIGMASGQRVKRSIHVRMYTHLSEGGRGPIRSTCTLSKRVSGVAKVDSGVVVWWWIFECWQVLETAAIPLSYVRVDAGVDEVVPYDSLGCLNSD